MCDGIGLFIVSPNGDTKKEYILSILQDAFAELHIETCYIDLSQTDALESLTKYFDYMLSIPADKKHFIFSLDGDGFEISVHSGGFLIDYVPYNVFSYLTMHPKYLDNKLKNINSWVITLFTSTQNEVSYIEQNYPHLDGTESMIFPAFPGINSELSVSERFYDIMLITDSTECPFYTKLLNELKCSGYSLCISSVVEPFPEKLNHMGNSKITIFIHNSTQNNIDTDIISALANGSAVFTEWSSNLTHLFKEGEEIFLYHREDTPLMLNKISSLLEQPEYLSEKITKSQAKAKKSGSIHTFAQNILKRCK